MGIFTAIDISASGLTAQRFRLDLIANNIANVNTTRTNETTPEGNPIPYRRQVAAFAARPAETNFGETLEQALKGNSTMGLNSRSLASSGNGVQVQAILGDESPFQLEYNPDSPDAAKVEEEGIPVGYIRMPNINIVTEMVDMISASRAYEANVTAMNAAKSMMSKALEIGRG